MHANIVTQLESSWFSLIRHFIRHQLVLLLLLQLRLFVGPDPDSCCAMQFWYNSIKLGFHPWWIDRWMVCRSSLGLSQFHRPHYTETAAAADAMVLLVNSAEYIIKGVVLLSSCRSLHCMAGCTERSLQFAVYFNVRYCNGDNYLRIIPKISLE